MIRKHIKNLIIGSSKLTTGFGQRKQKNYRRKTDRPLLVLPVRSAARGVCLAFVPVLTGNGNSRRKYAMGDKGKKDKEKSRKQKIVKQTQESKKAQEKVAIKLPLSKA
jgi:hypothetical protein